MARERYALRAVVYTTLWSVVCGLWPWSTLHYSLKGHTVDVSLISSIPDPWIFLTDLDPRIRRSLLCIRICGSVIDLYITDLWGKSFRGLARSRSYLDILVTKERNMITHHLIFYFFWSIKITKLNYWTFVLNCLLAFDKKIRIHNSELVIRIQILKAICNCGCTVFQIQNTVKKGWARLF